MSNWINILGRVILIFHVFPIIWTQPLISEDSPVAPTPFYHQDQDAQDQAAVPEAVSPDSHHGSSIMMHGMQNGGQRQKPMMPRVGSLCSLFRTFLDARSVNCRVSLRNRQEDDSHQGLTSDLDTNALVQIQSESMSRHESDQSPMEGSQGQMSSDRMDRGSEEDDEEPMDHLHHYHGILEDQTRILQHKTTIVVPEPRCPHGQRRDPRGYCRTVLRIRPYYGHGHGQQVSVRPIKYYYRRFVAVPTLHFILPH